MGTGKAKIFYASDYHFYHNLALIRSRSDEFKILCNMEKALSACVEINNYEPCTLEELINNNKKFKNGL